MANQSSALHGEVKAKPVQPTGTKTIKVSNPIHPSLKVGLIEKGIG